MENFENKNLDSIKTIIQDSNLDSSMKNYFSRLAEKVWKYNEKRYESIEKEIFKPKPENFPFVVTALIERKTDEEKKNFGFYRQCIKSSEKEIALFDKTEINKPFDEKFYPNSSLAKVFIEEDYDKMKNVAVSDKTFKGTYEIDGVKKEFEYQLKFDDFYLESQKILDSISKIYKTDFPVLYNPYATKYHKIVVKDSLPEKVRKVEQIDFRFEENGLKVVRNAELCWNLQLKTTDVLQGEKEKPYGKEIKYKYSFPKSTRKESNSKEFLIPLGNQTIVYDVSVSENGIDLWLNQETASFLKVIYYEFNESTESIELKKTHRIFSNEFYSSLRPTRICTESDIEYAIRPFREFCDLGCSVEKNNENFEPISSYSTTYLASRGKNSNFSKIKTVQLKFSEIESENKIAFKTDYINFVIQYLTRLYPEILWIGGR